MQATDMTRLCGLGGPFLERAVWITRLVAGRRVLNGCRIGVSGLFGLFGLVQSCQ